MEAKEPAVAYSSKYITPEQYLEMEAASAEKHEYYQGEVFAMAGATVAHNTISLNISAGLKKKLRGQPCRPYNSDKDLYRKEWFIYVSGCVGYLRTGPNLER